MASLAVLPLPVRIAGIAIFIIVLLAVSAKMPTMVLIGAIGCWVLAGATLVYSAGIYPGTVNLPVIGGLVRKMALPVPISARSPNSPSPPATVDRPSLIRAAKQQLQALAGNHPAVAFIIDNLIPLAQNRAAQKRPSLGAERAWIGLIHGPSGVGKSVIARALADLLIGFEAVRKPLVVPLPAPSSGRDVDWTDILERGIDSVVLVDNAHWFADKSPYTQTTRAEDFLTAMNALTESYPGRQCIVVTMTTEQRDQALGSVNAKALMRRLTVVDLPCGEIDDVALSKIFVSFLAKQDLTVEPGVDRSAIRLIRRQRDFEREKFDHAEAVRRVAERMSMRLAQSNRTRVTSQDVADIADTLDIE